jgi:predicted DNA-binding antitoxin AbrB/MazE fold protein
MLRGVKMDSGLISTDMKTITLADVKVETSLELKEEKPKVFKPKPKLALPEAINLDAKVTISEEDKKAAILTKEKEALEEILNMLEDVRLNLTDSGGQGFLMNASATISGYIRNAYRDEATIKPKYNSKLLP